MNDWRKRLMTVVGGIALAATLALVAPGDSMGREVPALVQGTIYVDVDAAGQNDGSSWENAHNTLQAALDAAAAGDQIWVAAGTYKPTHESSPGNPRSATFQLKNGVALYGGFDPSIGDIEFEDRDWLANATILSGDLGTAGTATDNSYHVFYHPVELALDASAILDGFTITAGYANGSDPNNRGGGMYNKGSSPTVTHCTFTGNVATYGGGMHNEASSSPTVTECTFSNNSASYGGGMANLSSSPAVTKSTFSHNSATSGAGGMYNQTSSPVVTDCTFSGNSATSGGGMGNWSLSAPVVTNCIFSGNSVTSSGGGMYNYDHATPIVTNCTFSGNSAGYLGGGIYDGGLSTLTATNCILWGNTPSEIAYNSSTQIVTYSDIQGGHAGTGNIDSDPLLDGPAMGDFHLLSDSPCIDAGTNSAPELPATDFEGDPRIVDGDGNGTATADMGADELAFHTLVLQMAGNGSGTVQRIPDDARVAHGTIVTLTATADTGSSFTDWSGDVAGTANPITLTMDTNQVVTATFTLDIHTLGISYAGNGSGLVSLDPPGGAYDYGTVVTLTAVADPGSSFTGWSGDVGGSTNPVTLTMDADKAVTPTFITHLACLPLVMQDVP